MSLKMFHFNSIGLRFAPILIDTAQTPSGTRRHQTGHRGAFG
jgi:hypothetical protein